MTNTTPPPVDTKQPQASPQATPQEVVKLEDLEKQVLELSDSVQKQNISQSQFQSSMLTIQQQLSTLRASVDSEKQRQKSTLEQMSRILGLLKTTVMPKYKSVEDVPGIRIPRWFDVVLDFSMGFENAYQNLTGILEKGSPFVLSATQSISIGPEGPFIVTQITPLIQITGPLLSNRATFADNVPEIGRIVPATTYHQVVNNLGKTINLGLGYNTPSLSALAGRTAGLLDRGVLNDLSEFNVSIKVAGNGRLWTDTPIPTADLFGTNGYPTFVGTQGIFEKLDRIQITAIVKTDLGNPDAIFANVQNRKLRICFHGYQILNPITLCDVLGY